MTLSYKGLLEQERTEISAEITTDHPASHYRQPVIVLQDGNVLDFQSAAMLDYRIEHMDENEAILLQKWQAVSKTMEA